MSYMPLVLQAWLAQALDAEDVALRLGQLQATMSFVVLRLQSLEERLTAMSGTVNTLDQAISNLTSEVTQDGDVASSAAKLIAGISAQLSQVQTQLQQAGVQPAQLVQLTQLQTTLQSQRQALATAVASGTPVDANSAAAQAGTGQTGTVSNTTTEGTATADQPTA